MRTTVTLDADTEALLRGAMRERGVSFKQALNDAIRAGLLAGVAGRSPNPVKVPTFDLGQRADAGIDLGKVLDKALTVAAALEDDELARKLSLGK